jgi:hypothetical protein
MKLQLFEHSYERTPHISWLWAEVIVVIKVRQTEVDSGFKIFCVRIKRRYRLHLLTQVQSFSSTSSDELEEILTSFSTRSRRRLFTATLYFDVIELASCAENDNYYGCPVLEQPVFSFHRRFRIVAAIPSRLTAAKPASRCGKFNARSRLRRLLLGDSLAVFKFDKVLFKVQSRSVALLLCLNRRWCMSNVTFRS